MQFLALHCFALLATTEGISVFQPGIDIVELLPNVKLAEREAYESFAASQGLRNSFIVEPNGRNSRAANRSNYLPVLYTSPGPNFPVVFTEFTSNVDMYPLA